MSVGGRVCLSVCRGCVCLSVGVCVCVYVVGERQLLEPTVGKANQSHPGVISPLESTTNPHVQYNILQCIWLFS